MAALVMILTGVYALGWGLARGYVHARAAVLPLTGGEPTRALIESAKPLYARARFRAALRYALLAFLWLAVALYGLFLATVGVEVFR